ncbi:MAG: aldehyde dehydrogenase family protein [Spirochaetes bacterium]|nr:aldehyde dehydrogenase family protein [Spirochaetota bacterium]MBU1082378.1 aldehyde dehydrogenase family protein [Spirochaetota bacterium]
MNDNERTIAGLVARARAAQAVAAEWDQARVDEACVAVGWAVYNDDNIARLAASAVEETGMGVVADKVAKHKNKVLGVLRDLRGAKSVGLIEVDEARGLRKYAKPVGVVGALAPVTNPTATPSSNGLSILKGRNAVIFAPHPKAKRSSAMAVGFMRAALEKVGAPADLVQLVEEPSVELTQELMRQVDLVVATGGGAMVKAAYSSGTPAYGVGPGNAVQLLAEDADPVDAAAKISASKAFDNATSCSSENSVVAHDAVYAAFVEAMKAKGGHLCSADEKAKLRSWLWIAGKDGREGLNPRIIAKSAESIARGAGFAAPAGTRFLMVEAEGSPDEEKFAQEKISPVLTLWRCASFDEGLGLVVGITDACGTGHSSGVFSSRPDYIDRMGLTMRSSRVMVRQGMASGNGGTFANGMPSTVTLGCGTWGGNITTENIHWRHFINVTWLSLPLPASRPGDDEIFGAYLAKYGA